MVNNEAKKVQDSESSDRNYYTVLKIQMDSLVAYCCLSVPTIAIF